MNLLRELNESIEDVESLPILEALEEALGKMNLSSRGGKIKSGIKGAADLFKANPGLAAGAAALAVSAVGQYNKNKRDMITLHAKTSQEKKMMTSIVDTLTKGGKFKVQRVKFEGGGKSWILKRKWT